MQPHLRSISRTKPPFCQPAKFVCKYVQSSEPDLPAPGVFRMAPHEDKRAEGEAESGAQAVTLAHWRAFEFPELHSA